ncbi:caspase domain-containing protein [Phycomyces blakesleeanus]|uniref:Caspase domain-containing protein n=1 Tax=Phycomyces blakesleeanus TaxID=4837 RepID=A0ABR3AXU6_PHYBL
MSGAKRDTTPLKEGQTKIIRRVTQSRTGDIIKEVEVVEEHKCINGKIIITTTTTTTTKKAPAAVEAPKLDPVPSNVTQVTTTATQQAVGVSPQGVSVTEAVTATATTTNTATATATTTAVATPTPAVTTTVTETITSDVPATTPPIAATPVVTTTVSETITSGVPATTPPVATTPVVTTTVTETINSDVPVVTPPAAATPVVTTTVTETITSDVPAVTSPAPAVAAVAATPVVTTTVTETITSDTPAVVTSVAATPVVTTTVTETITTNATVAETATVEAATTETTTETQAEETKEEEKEAEPEKVQPPYFEISNFRGKRRALIIGINYINGGGQLSGCINDAINIKKFLVNFYGYRESDIILMTDDTTDPYLMPTNHNIRKAMAEMCRDSQLNDCFFFHYSGHGGHVDDTNGDEVDGKDETICPSDYQIEGQIIDDDMYDLLVRPLCVGSRLTAVFDSCHSGTALDLPYIYSPEGHIKTKSLIRQAGEGLLGISTSHKGGAMNLISSFMELGQEMIKTRQIEAHHRELNTSLADVIMFSGCDDHEYSCDAVVSNEATGAMSYALIRTLSENPDQTYQELLKNVRKMTVLKYDQTPQLSSSHPIDLSKKFIC